MRHLMLLQPLFHGHYSAPVELSLQLYVVHAWRDLERIPELYMYSVCVTFLLWLCSCCRHCCFSESKKRFSFVQEIKGESFVQRVKDLRSENEKLQMVLLMKKD
jgi:hypothetical protein